MDNVNILCDDILRIIFQQTRYSLLSTQKIDITGVLRITQVCRRWRNVARDDPLLWTTLDGSKPTEIEWCLPLTKKTPIHFVFFNPATDPIFPAFAQSTTLLIPHLSRLRSLTLGGQWNAFRTFLDIIVPSRVPHLENLHLSPSFSTSLGTDTDYLPLPDSEMEKIPLFTLNFPRIKHVRFENYAPPLNSTIWNARDSIHLNVSPFLSPNVLEELFSRSPGLRNLFLSYSFSLEVRLGRRTPSTISSVPHLENLTLFTDLESISVFIGTFSMPKLSTINLLVWDLNIQRSLKRAFFHGDQRLHLLEKITHLKLEASNPKASMGRQLEGRSSSNEQILCLEFCRYSPLALQDMLQIFCNVQTLTITGDFVDIIWDIGIAPTIRTLRLERVSTMDILEEFVHRRFFQHLERLELSNVPFYPRPNVVLPLLKNAKSPSIHMSQCRICNQIPPDVLEQYRTSGITIEWVPAE